jgi:V8-like Glu-specific endopeptidase
LAGAQNGSMVWTWRGMAVINDDNNDSDPDQVWHEHMRLADTSEPSRTDAAAAPVRSSGKWIAVNLETGFEYEVELSDELVRSFRVYMEQTGQHQAHTGSAAGSREPRPALSQEGSAPALTKGWSNGMDTRTRRFDNTTYPYRTLGQLGGGRTSGCSGTLIGPRHVLTAAHCIWDMKTDSWVSAAGARFRPGREGTCNNAACEPYGGFNPRWYFTPAEFRQVDNNWTYDYGIIVTWGRPGDTTGWMGYVAANQNTLHDYCDKVPFGPGYLGGNCFSRGYPACDLSGAPQNCAQGWAYQDQNPCEIGSFIWPATAGDGWDSNFTTNCDLSGGHSGSSVWTDVWNGSGKVVFGVVSTHSCTTCSGGTSFPNRIRRVTPDVLDWISYFKTVKFP